MAETKTLTFALMDAPYECERTTTALRLIASSAEPEDQVQQTTRMRSRDSK
jgi:hypothetical protein